MRLSTATAAALAFLALQTRADDQDYSERLVDDLPWTVNCETDFISDSRRCSVTKKAHETKNWLIARKELKVSVIDGEVCFSASDNSDPRYTARIRIDDQAEINYEGTVVCGAIARRIVRQMLSGSRVRVQTHAWPTSPSHPSFLIGEQVQFEAKTMGLKEALEDLPQKPRLK